MSCLLFVMTGCSGHSKNLKFGAADIGGVYYSFASTFTQLADKEIDGYTFETKTTAGSVANLRLISDGYIDLAIVQADLLSDAYNATGTFADKKYQKGYKAVASLYTECCQIVVRKDSGITGIDDLINKTVSVGASESGSEKNAEQILKMSGITDELINKVNMDYTEAAEKLKAGEIDAFFCTAGTRTEVIGQLSKECDICLISLDDKCIDKMLSAYSLCEKYTIPAGTYNIRFIFMRTKRVGGIFQPFLDGEKNGAPEISGYDAEWDSWPYPMDNQVWEKVTFDETAPHTITLKVTKPGELRWDLVRFEPVK